MAKCEAFVEVAYLDDTMGSDHYSLGFGFPGVKGETITLEAAWIRLKANVEEREPKVAAALTKAVSPQVFDALMSLYYQAGSEALAGVATWYNKGDLENGALEFRKWNFGRNKLPTVGHTIRRGLEALIAAAGYYDNKSYWYFYGDPHDIQTKRELRTFPDDLAVQLGA